MQVSAMRMCHKWIDELLLIVFLTLIRSAIMLKKRVRHNSAGRLA